MPDRDHTALVVDNFTLQDIGDTLQHGLTDDQRAEIVPSSDPAGYAVLPVPSAGVQVETLLQFLNVVILQEQLIVDAASVKAWREAESIFKPLLAQEIVDAKSFADKTGEWAPRRDYIQEILCFSPQLATDFATYRANWKLTGHQSPVFSTLLWGTAGMLARSEFLNAPYLGHPSRGRLIDRSSLAPSRVKAQDVVHRFITSERIKLFDRTTAGQKTRALTLSLPPLALEAIAESRDITQLIPTAIQLRDKYSKLREWIGEYQRALETDPAAAAKHMATLEAAANDIERLFSGSWWAKLTIDIGLSLTEWPKLGSNISAPVGAAIQRLLPGSIRSAVTKLIQRPWDNSALEKLFQMLDCKSPKLRHQTLRHLQGV